MTRGPQSSPSTLISTSAGPALERQIIADLLERDNRFRARSGEWTELVLAIKQLAVSGASPEAVLKELEDGEERVKNGDKKVSQGGESQC